MRGWRLPTLRTKTAPVKLGQAGSDLRRAPTVWLPGHLERPRRPRLQCQYQSL